NRSGSLWFLSGAGPGIYRLLLLPLSVSGTSPGFMERTHHFSPISFQLAGRLLESRSAVFIGLHGSGKRTVAANSGADLSRPGLRRALFHGKSRRTRCLCRDGSRRSLVSEAEIRSPLASLGRHHTRRYYCVLIAISICRWRPHSGCR